MYKTLLKIPRVLSELSQFELFGNMDLSQSAISKYETGERAITFEAERKLKLIAFDFVLLKMI